MSGGDSVIRIVVVDDHPVVRAGLRRVLEAEDDIAVVGEAGDAVAALEVIDKCEPDLVVLDVHLGSGPGGIDILRSLRALERSPQVLVVTVLDNDLDVDAALGEGAAGYILKDAPEGDLVRAVRAVVAGLQPLDPRVAARVIARSLGDSAAPSPRELEVLTDVAAGFDNATIARRLYISQATVKSHLASVFIKLGAASRTAAVAEARRRGHIR